MFFAKPFGFSAVGLLVALCSFCASSPAAGIARNDGTSWPTLRGDLCRSGFYPEFPPGSLKLTWRQELHQELTGPRSEVIVAGGLAFMGTYRGRFYAWDAATGEQRWVFAAADAIGHSPAYADGTVFVGSMDRRLYALDTATGREQWRFEAAEGIWSSPAVHAGRVFFGGRDGLFHALDTRSGELQWKFATGDRILTSPAFTADGARVFIASEDMHLYCLRVNDGALLWKSRKLQGLSTRDWTPVVNGSLVFMTTNPVKDFHTILGQNEQMLVARTGFSGKDNRYIPGTAEDVAHEQEAVVSHLRAQPAEQTFYAFRTVDGTEPWIAPILYQGGLHNPLAPPCYHPATGETFTLLRSAYSTWDGGGEVRSFGAIGQLNLETGRIALISHSHPSREPERPPGSKDLPWGTFNLIGDETQVLSCAPGRIFSNHQGFVGALDLAAGSLRGLFGKRDTYGGFYGPGTFGWEKDGGYDKARAAGQPFGLPNEWHGPARAIMSVAGGRVYYHTGAQVLCFSPAE